MKTFDDLRTKNTNFYFFGNIEKVQIDYLIINIIILSWNWAQKSTSSDHHHLHYLTNTNRGFRFYSELYTSI